MREKERERERIKLKKKRRLPANALFCIVRILALNYVTIWQNKKERKIANLYQKG